MSKMKISRIAVALLMALGLLAGLLPITAMADPGNGNGNGKGGSEESPSGESYTYVLNLDSNGGKFTSNGSSYVGNETVRTDTHADASNPKQAQKFTLPNEHHSPSRDDYDFLGWSTDSQATTPEYFKTDHYVIEKDTEATLYAVWQLKQPGGGGSGTPDPGGDPNPNPGGGTDTPDPSIEPNPNPQGEVDPDPNPNPQGEVDPDPKPKEDPKPQVDPNPQPRTGGSSGGVRNPKTGDLILLPVLGMMLSGSALACTAVSEWKKKE